MGRGGGGREPGQRCGMPGCGRFVGTGERWCGRHREEGDEEPEGALGAPAGSEFRRRLQAANYRELFGEALAAVLAQAAAERPLADEIGALRVTLARLLVEEEDVGKLATSVARVAAVAVQAARVQSALGQEQPDEAAEILRTLEALGKG